MIYKSMAATKLSPSIGTCQVVWVPLVLLVRPGHAIGYRRARTLFGYYRFLFVSLLPIKSNINFVECKFSTARPEPILRSVLHSTHFNPCTPHSDSVAARRRGGQ